MNSRKKPLIFSLFFLSTFLITSFYFAALQGDSRTESLNLEPWGQEGALIKKRPQVKKKRISFLENAGGSLIWFHKKVISPADGPRSYHKPNSSQYTLDAMEKYGFLQGFLMGCDRLMRENSDPWIYPSIEDEEGILFKWDPVK